LSPLFLEEVPMRHLRSRALIVAVAAMVSSGCFGSFQAVRTVYSWNKSFGDGNKWAQELMYISTPWS
jgi:hypothetical protein